MPRIKFDVRLIPSLNDVRAIPVVGNNLIVVCEVNKSLHVRIFDGGGTRIVDLDEKSLGPSRQIEDLRERLENKWAPYNLSWSEKNRISFAVTSIVGRTHCNIDGFDVREEINECCERVLRKKRMPPEELLMFQNRTRDNLANRVQLIIPTQPILPDPHAFLDDLISVLKTIVLQVCLDTSIELNGIIEAIRSAEAAFAAPSSTAADFDEISHCTSPHEVSATLH